MAALLSNSKLTLRAPEVTDTTSFLIWENDSDAWRDSSTLAPMSRRQMWDYVENYRGDIFAERQLRLVIEENSSGKAVGAVDLFNFDPVNLHCHIGLYIAKPHRGKGYGKEAVELMQTYAFGFLHIHQLIAIAREDNSQSVAVFETLGYNTIATLPQYFRHGNVYVSARLFSKINPE